jgi:electron transport complex protein RnfB
LIPGAGAQASSQATAQEQALADALDAALPQTQCTRCGFPDCRRYAQAIARGEAAVNRCPPGGLEGVVRLAAIAHRPVIALDTARGVEGPRKLAVIDEAWCIGCTLCIKACPVDCIVGAPRRMHTVVNDECTGCELCLPACPVDCIAMPEVTAPLTGWAAWSPAQAQASRQRYRFHLQRVERDQREEDERLARKARARRDQRVDGSPVPDPMQPEQMRTAIEATLARTRQRQGTGEAT